MNYHLLIVEDDESIRETLNTILTDEGFDVTTAVNGQEAWNFLEQESPLPSLILLDLSMPVMSGTELLEKVKKHPRLKKIPVAIFTAFGTKNISPLADAVIQKPIQFKDLLQRLEKLLPRETPGSKS